MPSPAVFSGCLLRQHPPSPNQHRDRSPPASSPLTDHHIFGHISGHTLLPCLDSELKSNKPERKERKGKGGDDAGDGGSSISLNFKFFKESPYVGIVVGFVSGKTSTESKKLLLFCGDLHGDVLGDSVFRFLDAYFIDSESPYVGIVVGFVSGKASTESKKLLLFCRELHGDVLGDSVFRFLDAYFIDSVTLPF
ncbi:hypothetical protein L6452_40179 [Arctium lappa]|uniref:Uncharacterized protein n=1 Tax=Arctium lappa TaxID=4217 RepID=A0ACB8XL76_ARCLA|nr:hypothetical protein L6452_40179 [Arctium lappa]